MVKLIQTKYIKHLFILTAFAFLLSYQQVAKTITSASDLLDIILSEKGFDTSVKESSKLFFATIIISDNVADDYEGEDTLKDFVGSQQAFNSILADSSSDPVILDEAGTLVVVQALSLVVGMMDIIIEDGKRYSDMSREREAIFDDDANNPIAALATGLGQIAEYEELFSMYLDFLNDYIVKRTSSRGIQIIRNAFESGDDYTNGNRAFRQTPECSSLFCSLYTLRRENPDTYITEFVVKQMQINEYFADAVEDARPELRVLVEGFNVEGTNETLNSLRQSKVPNPSKTPDVPPAPPQNIPETPVISDDCKMAPSLPGC
jgi:hypothetical protein